MRSPRSVTLLSLAFWVLFVLTRIGVVLRVGGVEPLADDLARLAQIDALLAGQGWWDLTMYRLGPDGVAMHWTRHVDALFLALGGGFEALRPFAFWALPLLLALAVFLLMGRLAEELGGRRAVPASLLLLLASVLAATQFSPGRIDHHGLQIVLVLLAVLGVLRFERSRWALVAGVALGMSLSVGLEQALVAAGVMAAVALVVVVGRPGRQPVELFAGGLVGSAVLGTVIFSPPERLVTVACDVFSGPHLLAIVVASVGLVVASRVARPLVAIAGSWSVAALGTLALAPRCVDPYADVAPLLREFWLPNVSEAQSLMGALSSRPGFGYAILIPAVVAVAFAIWRWSSGGWSATTWGRMFFVVALGSAGSLLQLRAASTATAIGAVVLGVLFADLYERLGGWPMPARVATMTAVALVVSGLGPLVVLSPRPEAGAPTGGLSVECGHGLVEAGLAGMVLAPIDLGPSLLARTDARVLAGPYHRNNDGNLRAWQVLTEPPDPSALEGIDWVVACEGMPENGILIRSFGPGLLADLLDGDVPGFLEPVPSEADGLLLYRVRG